MRVMQTPLLLLITMRCLRQREPVWRSSLEVLGVMPSCVLLGPICRLPEDPTSLLPVPATRRGSHTRQDGKQEH